MRRQLVQILAIVAKQSINTRRISAIDKLTTQLRNDLEVRALEREVSNQDVMRCEPAFGKREVGVLADGHDQVLLHFGSGET